MTKSAFFVLENAKWNSLQEKVKLLEIGVEINNAMPAIENEISSLKLKISIQKIHSVGCGLLR